jgi:sec-independent protein translocase protein TatA
MFGNIGLPEILIILLVVILLFGAKKIPELAKGLGLGLKEFKKAAKDEDKEKVKETTSEKSDKKEDATA